MKTFCIITIIVSVFFILFVSSPAYAPCAIGPNGTQTCGGPPQIHMTITHDSFAYAENDTVTILGKVDQYILSNYGRHLSIKIYNPQMMLYRSDQFQTSSDGSFSYSFKIKGNLALSGYYNVYVSPDEKIMSYGTAFEYQAIPYDLILGDKRYPVTYVVDPGSLDEIDASLQGKSIVLHVVNATSPSVLRVDLPRTLIDSASDTYDSPFTVLVGNSQETRYMKPANFNETLTNSETRRLVIDLPYNPYMNPGKWYVKIIGTSIASGYENTVNSPLKQFRLGVSSYDVICQSGLQLIIKKDDSLHVSGPV